MFRLWIIDLIRATRIGQILKELRSEQFADRQVLDTIRQRKLEKLFRKAQRSTTYYASFHEYEEVPMLSKKKLRANTSDYFSMEYRRRIFQKETGGSTGEPLIYYTTAEAQSYMWASILLAWETAGYRPGDRVAMVAGSSVVKSSWKHDLFYKILNVKVYSALMLDEGNITSYLNGIKRSGATIIYGYANAIGQLADHINSNSKISFPDLRGIVTTAEVLTDKVRKNIERAFGVPVFNQYGCNEAGISAFECEHHRLHLISSRCIYEIAPNNHLCGTDLANEAFIMMKFDTGDIVDFADEEHCGCGRSYPIIKNIVGRSNDLVVDDDNNVVHSAFFGYLFRKDSNIRQFQVVFDKEKITINLRVETDGPQQDYSKYLATVKKHLKFKHYEIVINAPFLTTENAKHKYVVNNRHETPAHVFEPNSI